MTTNHHLNSIFSFKKTCENFFSECGYIPYAAEPIVPRADKSILYTNSAIIPFKNMIIETNIPQLPQYLLQECIRLHETKMTPNEQYFMQRMSYFNMFGVFAPIGWLNQACHDMVTLLLDVLLVDRDRLVFHASSEDAIFWSSLKKIGVNILWDKTPADDYQWSYGIADVIGRGLNIGIIPNGTQPEAISFVDEIDIGQIIVIKNKDQPICFEIALGVEAFLWRTTGKKSPFAVSEIAAFLPFKFDPLHIQLMDALALSVIFYGNSIDLFPGNSLKPAKGKKRLSAVKKAVKNIAEIKALMQADINISKVIVEYARYRGFPSNRIARLLQAISLENLKFSQKESKLFEYSAACARAIKKNNLTYEEACRRLRNKAKKKYSLYHANFMDALNAMNDMLSSILGKEYN